MIVDKIFTNYGFDLIVNGDEFEGKGKPNPELFRAALQRLTIENNSSDAIVVENAALGVKAAKKAAIPCVVTLNTSPLTLADFERLISKGRIFNDTVSTGKFLKK